MPGKKDLPTDASGKELTEVYLEQLKMKPAGRQKKATEQPAMPNRGLTAQYLQTLPLHELVALAKHQEAEINDIDAKIYTASYRHYVGTYQDDSICPRKVRFGRSKSSELLCPLLQRLRSLCSSSSPISRSNPFFPWFQE
jgi:hypothetical protein